MEGKPINLNILYRKGWRKVETGWLDPDSGYISSVHEAMTICQDRLEYYDSNGRPPIRMDIRDNRRLAITIWEVCESCSGMKCNQCFYSGYIFKDLPNEQGE